MVNDSKSKEKPMFPSGNLLGSTTRNIDTPLDNIKMQVGDDNTKGRLVINTAKLSLPDMNGLLYNAYVVALCLF